MTIDWTRMQSAADPARLAEARAQAEARLVQAIGAASQTLTSGAPLTLKQPWASKEEAARALADWVQRTLMEEEGQGPATGPAGIGAALAEGRAVSDRPPG